MPDKLDDSWWMFKLPCLADCLRFNYQPNLPDDYVTWKVWQCFFCELPKLSCVWSCVAYIWDLFDAAGGAQMNKV